MKRAPHKDLRHVRTGLAGYATLLTHLKQRIRSAQIKAALSVNRELIQLYWDVGRAIVVKQKQEGWGTAVIAKLAADLQREFPDLSGFSRPNIYRMRAFFPCLCSWQSVYPTTCWTGASGVIACNCLTSRETNR